LVSDPRPVWPRKTVLTQRVTRELSLCTRWGNPQRSRTRPRAQRKPNKPHPFLESLGPPPHRDANENRVRWEIVEQLTDSPARGGPAARPPARSVPAVPRPPPSVARAAGPRHSFSAAVHARRIGSSVRAPRAGRAAAPPLTRAGRARRRCCTRPACPAMGRLPLGRSPPGRPARRAGPPDPRPTARRRGGAQSAHPRPRRRARRAAPAGAAPWACRPSQTLASGRPSRAWPPVGV